MTFPMAFPMTIPLTGTLSEPEVRADPEVLADPAAVGERVAALVLDRYQAADPSRPFLLGVPSGRSLATTYRAMARMVQERSLDLSRLVLVLMDEYATQTGDGTYQRVDPSLAHSCVGFGRREILEPLLAAAAGTSAAAGASGTAAASAVSSTAAAAVGGPAALWSPDPADPARYDAEISAHGGIDVFLLASGARDGHIALNQPGTPRLARTHVATLGRSTRQDNLETFPELGDLDSVPRYGVTVGVGTIADLSREVVMVVTGAHKRETVERLRRARSYDPGWPATILAECARATFVVDAAAAG